MPTKRNSRRRFIRNAGLATAGAFVAPYILPSGRLFAQSGTRLVNHVVFVLFAGGIRQQESVEQGYLADQNIPYTGNLMENMLNGAPPPSNSLLYNRWQPILNQPLVAQGTLFREMRYTSGPTGHYNGHTAAITGNYTNNGVDLNINPDFPTLFEYYRKHNSPEKSAINAWWLSEGLGPYPALNFSRHGMYGPQYGANYFRPASTFGYVGLNHLADGVDFQPDDVEKIRVIKNYLDANFNLTASDLPGIINNTADRDQIEAFIKQTLQQSQLNNIPFPMPPGTGSGEINGDLYNIAYAWQVLNQLTPELVVINTFNSDTCHSNFTGYCQNLHKADYGVGWLWNKIQSHPILANDTIMICMPDHGRNAEPNNIYDNNGLRAYDHTSDENSRRVFSLIVGPPNKVKQNQVLGSISNPVGETIDIVPTIAHILGFNEAIPSGLLPGSPLLEAFV